jgi:hypothetical protein
VATRSCRLPPLPEGNQVDGDVGLLKVEAVLNFARDELLSREQGVAQPVELVPTLDSDGEIDIQGGAGRGNPEDVKEQ